MNHLRSVEDVFRPLDNPVITFNYLITIDALKVLGVYLFRNDLISFIYPALKQEWGHSPHLTIRKSLLYYKGKVTNVQFYTIGSLFVCVFLFVFFNPQGKQEKTPFSMKWREKVHKTSRNVFTFA